MDPFKYDVAISFLGGDLEVAQRLNELLRDQMQVFLFTERQGDVVGPDGIKTMNAVYGKEARIAVVLYREGWGTKGWTGVEATAIQNAGMDRGWDFVLMIPLEKHPTMPPWVPKGSIWWAYAHYGLEGTVPVIERMLEQLGGQAQPVTGATYLVRQARHNKWQTEREAKRRSEEGAAAARQHIVELVAEFEKTVTNQPAANIQFQRSGDSARIWTNAPERDGTTVTLQWSVPYVNTLSDSGLHVRLWDGYASLGGHLIAFEEPKKRAAHDFDFEWSEDGKWVWQHRDTKKLYDTAGIVTFCLGLLIEHSHRAPRRR